MTQGEPLDMIAYGIDSLRLIIELLNAHPCATHPWYDNDAGFARSCWQHTGPYPGLPGQGSNTALLPGFDQEHLGSSPVERWHSGDLLLRNGYESGH